MIEPVKFRKTLGNFATGVTIMTTSDEAGSPVGMTANSFSSLSLDPPMVLWSIAKTSSKFDSFNTSSHFAIHVLHQEQQHLSGQFSQKETDRFANVNVDDGVGGVPLLADYHARFQCEVAHRYDGGDHVIIVGEVKAMDENDHDPLMFYQGSYVSLAG